MKRREENLHRMLAISDTLAIKQDGATLDIVSAVESRRVVAGSRTQVSMPEGQLADSKVGWDGEWFVIDRRVRGGPRVVEKFRLVPKTGQLEYEMTWCGDGELDGMKVRRMFDRVTVTPPPADPRAAGALTESSAMPIRRRSSTPSPPWSRGIPSDLRGPTRDRCPTACSRRTAR